MSRLRMSLPKTVVNSEEEGEEEFSTEHYMTVRSEVMVELYTTDEDGVRQFLPGTMRLG